MVWALAVVTVGRKDEQPLTALADATKKRMKDFKLQNLMNSAWAFATVGRKEEQLFTVLADAAK